MSNDQARARRFIRFHLIGLAALFGIGTALILFYNPDSGAPKPSPENEPAPLAQGRQEYSIVSGGDGPNITTFIIDPFDPKEGETQTVEVHTAYREPIMRVTVLMLTDSTSSLQELARAAEGSGWYKGTWRVRDTHSETYGAIVRAETGKTSSSVELTFR